MKSIIYKKRPILRGRDIKKYKSEWAGLWLIGTHNGYHDNGQYTSRIDINDYPAIRDHLDKYSDKLQNRTDQGDTPYNLRSCKYWNEFFEPKIIYPNMTKYQPFIYDESGYLTNQKCFIAITPHKYLVAILNSRISAFIIKITCPELQGGTRELSKIFMEKISIPKLIDSKIISILEELVDTIQDAEKSGNIKFSLELQQEVNNIVYKIYNLTEQEVETIN